MAYRNGRNYGVKPIIYTTSKWYRKQIKGSFPDYDIWIRSVYSKPNKDVNWTFWQYSNRMRLDGYDGEEKYIDMNVFCGLAEEFAGCYYSHSNLTQINWKSYIQNHIRCDIL